VKAKTLGPEVETPPGRVETSGGGPPELAKEPALWHA